ncbi:MAG: cupin domain-containing protein [Bacteroidota bacterium]
MYLKSFQDCPAFLAGDHTQIRELLHPNKDTVPLNYSLAHASVGAGEASLPHILKRSSEVYVILQGEGEMHIDGETAPLKTGQLVYIPAGAKQHIVNTGTLELQFLCIVDPPWAELDEEVLEGGRHIGG